MTSKFGILGHKELAPVLLRDTARTDGVSTPYGDQLIEHGEVGGIPIVFIRFPGWNVDRPSHAIDKRRHVAAFKILGIDHFIDVTGFGAVSDRVSKGDIAISSDLLKLQPLDPPTAMQEGGWPRVNPGRAAGGPFCPRLRQALVEASQEVTNRIVHDDIVTSHTTGPHAETVAEIEAARRMGADLISTSLYATVIYGLEFNVFGASLAWVSNIAGDEYRRDWERIPQEETKAILETAISKADSLTCDCAGTPDEFEFARYPESWGVLW